MAWYSKYIGIPFVDKGREESGLDCWGLVRLVYKNELDIDLPDYLDYYESTNDRFATAKIVEYESNENWIIPDDVKEFDVIILNMRGVPMHVGIVTKDKHMIHCARGIGTTHENYRTSRWKHKVEGFARWKH